MVSATDAAEGSWKWREDVLPKLHIDFQCNGQWDVHIKRVQKESEKLHSIYH